jgi:hypothetical protein
VDSLSRKPGYMPNCQSTQLNLRSVTQQTRKDRAYDVISKGHVFAVVNRTTPCLLNMDQLQGMVGAVGERAAATHPDGIDASVMEGIEEFGLAGMVVRTITKSRAGCHQQAIRDGRTPPLTASVLAWRLYPSERAVR